MKLHYLKPLKRLLFLGIFCSILFPSATFAQTTAPSSAKAPQGTASSPEKLQFKFGGYMQGLLQVGQPNASTSVGNPNTENKYFTRMGLRRGYLSFEALYGDWSAKTEIRATDKALGVYRAYIGYKPSQVRGLGFTLGLNTVAFGCELPISSRLRETFERAAYIKDLFPGDVDMGLMAQYKMPLTATYVNALRIDLGILSGNADYGMRKAFPDLLLRVEFGHDGPLMSRRYGISGYYGYATAPSGQRARRHYFGGFLDYSLKAAEGIFKLRLEAMGGLQAGTPTKNLAIASQAPEKIGKEGYTLRERTFAGAMAMLTYRHNHVPIEGVLKYDYYNRNINLKEALSKQKVGEQRSFSSEGISHSITPGLNAYLWDNRVRLSLFYEMYLHQAGLIDNNIPQWYEKDDILTFGVQFSF